MRREELRQYEHEMEMLDRPRRAKLTPNELKDFREARKIQLEMERQQEEDEARLAAENSTSDEI